MGESRRWKVGRGLWAWWQRPQRPQVKCDQGEGLLWVGLGEGWVCTMAMGDIPYETIAAYGEIAAQLNILGKCGP